MLLFGIKSQKDNLKMKSLNESKTRLKRDRPIGFKDKNSRKRKRSYKHDDPNMEECVLKEI